MSLWNELLKRLLYLLISLVFSIPLSFSFALIWMVIKGVILGYGDSGPDWVNTVTKWIQMVSVVICVVLSQVLFHYVNRKSVEK